MVLNLDGNSEKNRSFRRKKCSFVTALDLIKCLKQIKKNRYCSFHAQLFLSYHLIYKYPAPMVHLMCFYRIIYLCAFLGSTTYPLQTNAGNTGCTNFSQKKNNLFCKRNLILKSSHCLRESTKLSPHYWVSHNQLYIHMNWLQRNLRNKNVSIHVYSRE